MKKIVDLHIHTLSSDGTDTPNKILEELQKIGDVEQIEPIISFTDHDSISAYDNITIETSVKIIKGCEFTTRLGNTEIHILGYGFDLNDPELKEYFKKLRETKLERLNIYKKVLEKNNLFIPESFFKNIIKNNYGISASSIIYNLQEKTFDFDKYALYKEMMDSARGVARPFKEADEIINLIHNSGGFAFLAHPLNYNLPKDKLDDLLTNLKDLGLDGLELYHSDVSLKCLPFLKNRVNQHHFLVSGGSDFHGKDYTNRKLGYFNSVYLLPSTKISPQLLDSKYYYKKSPELTKE